LSADGFEKAWRAEILRVPPLIAPARQYTWPLAIAGEEDAMARGALQVMVYPSGGGSFLANCALGFVDPAMPSGVWSCPRETELCAVAGGYAYIVDIRTPERCTHIALRPVVAVHVAAEAGLLLFVGFKTLIAWGLNGLAWETPRLSWDGVKLETVEGSEARGFGWDLMADEEVPFRIDLRTGTATGGGYRLP
jgi:hypothetical protein